MGIAGFISLTILCDNGAFIISIGFWGALYYSHNKEPPPHNSFGNYEGPYIMQVDPKAMQESTNNTRRDV